MAGPSARRWARWRWPVSWAGRSTEPGWRLGAQPVALVHAEAVLLVDHDEAEAVELDGVLQERVCADDDARGTRGDLIAHLAFLRGRHRTGKERDPGRSVGPAELPGHGERTEHIADGLGVLGGEHLGGRKQCALVTRVDHLQHRQH